MWTTIYRDATRRNRLTTLESIRNGDNLVTRLYSEYLFLDDKYSNDLVAAASESVHVNDVELWFRKRFELNKEAPLELESLLSYLRHNTVLRKVNFFYPRISQLSLGSMKRQTVLQAFSQTIQAAQANHNVEYVWFEYALLSADELLSDGSFYQSLRRVTLDDDPHFLLDAYSEPERQTIQRAVRAMSSLENLYIDHQQSKMALFLLRSLHFHPRLQHLSVKGLEANMDTAHALSGVISSTPLTRLTMKWQRGLFTAEEFEIIAQGLLHCPTLDHLELSCYDVAETNLSQAARFFHQVVHPPPLAQ